MTKIVVAEDNHSYAEDVAEYLLEAGYQVDTARSARELWAALSGGYTDVVLLDLGLPDEDGLKIIPHLRKLHPDTGLIVLTARATMDNRIQGLRLGADGYLTKPIKFIELAAHIEALCRRLRPARKREQPLWVIRTSARQIELKGKGSVVLTEKEFNFLQLLAQSRQPVPRNFLLTAMGESEHRSTAAGKMDMLVYRLRKKIKIALGDDLPLRSEYGGGYGLSAPVHLV